MKKLLAAVLLCFLSAPAYADSGEVRFLFNSYVPLSPDNNWDSAYGLDIQLVNWLSPGLGVAVAAGASQWTAQEYYLDDYYPGSGTAVSAHLSGDATVCPVGLSFLFRPISVPGAQVIIETGARYAIVNSNVFAQYSIHDSSGTTYREDRIELNDGFYGVLGLDVAFPLSPFMKIDLGAGYQFDLSGGTAEYDGASIGDSDFEASIVRLGFNARF